MRQGCGRQPCKFRKAQLLIPTSTRFKDSVQTVLSFHPAAHNSDLNSEPSTMPQLGGNIQEYDDWGAEVDSDDETGVSEPPGSEGINAYSGNPPPSMLSCHCGRSYTERRQIVPHRAQAGFCWVFNSVAGL